MYDSEREKRFLLIYKDSVITYKERRKVSSLISALASVCSCQTDERKERADQQKAETSCSRFVDDKVRRLLERES